jgi:HK97 family phage major capsid protein
MIDRHGAKRRTLQPYQPGVTGSGPELIESTLQPGLYIPALYARSVVMQLGAQRVTNLRGDVVIPRMASGSAANWVTTSGTNPVVSGAGTEAEGTFDSSQIVASPSQLFAYGKLSRLMMQQSQSGLVDRAIAIDVSRTIGAAIDAAAISGSGSAGAPLGLTGISGTNSVSGTTLGFGGVLTAIQDISAANAVIDYNSLGWIAPPATAALLANRYESSAAVFRLWRGNPHNGTMLDLPALASTNVPAATLIAGDFSQILLLSWDDDLPVTIELANPNRALNDYDPTVNPYAYFSSGDLQYRAVVSCAVVVRHAPAFTIVLNVT